MKIASFILLPEKRFLALTSFQSASFPSLSLGNSSPISLRRQSLSLSRARFRPPGNIHNRSRLRRTKSTFPLLFANSFADFAMSIGDHLCRDATFKTAAIVADTLILGTAKIGQANRQPRM